MPYSHKTYLQQVGLKRLGFDPGLADGYDGPKTKSAYKASLAKRHGSTLAVATKLDSNGYPPPPKPQNKTSVFGRHGIKGGFTPKMAKAKVPFKMFLYKDGGRVVKTISCHHLVAKPLENFLAELYAKLGDAGIRKYGFHLWFGCYVPRKSRGGSSQSDHSWAVANDWNAHANGNHQRWISDKKMTNGTHQFSKQVVAIARKHGFQVGFKKGSYRRDMMHFAYINRS